jgi:hypothetical protein
VPVPLLAKADVFGTSNPDLQPSAFGGKKTVSVLFVDVNEMERGLDQMMKDMRQKTRTK